MELGEYFNQILLDNEKGFYIYGAGKIGHKIVKIIKSFDMLSSVKAIIVTRKYKNEIEIEGIPIVEVASISDTDKDLLVLVAVADVYQNDVLDELHSREFKNVLLAYKFAYIGADDVPTDFPSTTFIDLRELFLSQFMNDCNFNRYDILVRLITAKRYIEKIDNAFEMYERMQDKRNGNGYSKKAVNRYIKLIDSVMQNGYDLQSEILVDSNLHLRDGSHRMALAIMLGIPKVKIRITTEDFIADFGKIWVEENLTFDDKAILDDALLELKDKYSTCIKGIIWPMKQELAQEIKNEIESEYKLNKVEQYVFPEKIFVQFVKGVYNIDDIEPWKIEKKIQCFGYHEEYIVTILDIEMGYPNFRLKRNGKTICHSGELLKKHIRDLFKDRVEQYFPDILFHTGDNYEHSRYIDLLVHTMFSMRPFFNSISNYKWMLLKTGSKYYPNDFPDSFPRYKDIDMIADPDDVSSIILKCIEYFETKVVDGLSISITESKNENTKISLILEGFMICMIDVSYGGRLDKKAITTYLKRRERVDCFFVPNKNDEKVI